MKKLKLLLGILLCAGLSAIAQQKGAAISFDQTTHNFDTINELDGPATYEFEFVNTGDEPLILENVRASCGCTTPSYSKEPVLPGEKGFIMVSYNPKNRPGPFSKGITVQSNAIENPTSHLKISGIVKPGPKADM